VSNGAALAASIGALALVGCARGGAEARITSTSTSVVYARSIQALAHHGFDCKVQKGQLVCDGDRADRATIFISYAPPADRASGRLVFVAFDRLDAPCSTMLPEINRFNYEFDFAQVSCRDEGAPMLFYVGNVYLPEQGLSPRDLGGYAAWWSSGLATAVRASHLVRARPKATDAQDPALHKL